MDLNYLSNFLIPQRKKELQEGKNLATMKANSSIARIVAPVKLRNRYFFPQNSTNCFKLESIVDMMKSDGLLSQTIYLANKECNMPYFYCKFYLEVGDKNESSCGNCCNGYQPKNKKSGACKHYGYTYSQGDAYRIDISGSTAKINLLQS